MRRVFRRAVILKKVVRMRLVSFLLTAALLAGPPASASFIELSPLKDNTLIQQSSPAAQLSNGQGDLFVGRTNQDGQGPATISIRRGLVEFDLSGIPTGSIITGATLTVRDVMGLNGDPTVELRRLLRDWGEGTSFFNGGQGAAATNGDATWLYTFFNAANPTSSPTWSTPGGDFSPTVSAFTIISDDAGGGQPFAWSSVDNPRMLADLQFWLDNPSSNYGWLIKGDESRGQSAKRLNSGESLTPPILRIEYAAVPEASSLLLAACAAVGGLLARGVRRRQQAKRPS